MTQRDHLQLREHFDDDGSIRLALIGELDLASVDVVAARLRELRRGGYNVRLDLTELEFMDSSGLTQLIRAVTESRDNGWRLEIGTELTAPVSRLIELTGTRSLFWPED